MDEYLALHRPQWFDFILVCTPNFQFLRPPLRNSLECSSSSTMEFLIMHETRVHLLVCMNIWIRSSSPTYLAKMSSYIRIHSDELNILNELIGVSRTEITAWNA